MLSIKLNSWRCIAKLIGSVLLVSGALIMLANEFIVGTGELTILGIGGDPSSRGMIFLVFGLLLTRYRTK